MVKSAFDFILFYWMFTVSITIFILDKLKICFLVLFKNQIFLSWVLLICEIEALSLFLYFFFVEDLGFLGFGNVEKALFSFFLLLLL